MYAIVLKTKKEKRAFERELKYSIPKSRLKTGMKVVVRARVEGQTSRFGREYLGVLLPSGRPEYDFVLHTARRSPDDESGDILSDLFVPLIVHNDGTLLATPVSCVDSFISDVLKATNSPTPEVPLVPFGYVLDSLYARSLARTVTRRTPSESPVPVAV